MGCTTTYEFCGFQDVIPEPDSPKVIINFPNPHDLHAMEYFKLSWLVGSRGSGEDYMREFIALRSKDLPNLQGT